MREAIINGIAIYIDFSNGDALDSCDNNASLALGRRIVARVLANQPTNKMHVESEKMGLFELGNALQLVSQILHKQVILL